MGSMRVRADSFLNMYSAASPFHSFLTTRYAGMFRGGVAGALPAATGSRDDSAVLEHRSRRDSATAVALVQSTNNSLIRCTRSVHPLASCSGIIQSFHAQHLHIQELVASMCSYSLRPTPRVRELLLELFSAVFCCFLGVAGLILSFM